MLKPYFSHCQNYGYFEKFFDILFVRSSGTLWNTPNIIRTRIFVTIRISAMITKRCSKWRKWIWCNIVPTSMTKRMKKSMTGISTSLTFDHCINAKIDVDIARKCFTKNVQAVRVPNVVRPVSERLSSTIAVWSFCVMFVTNDSILKKSLKLELTNSDKVERLLIVTTGLHVTPQMAPDFIKRKKENLRYFKII